MAKVMRLFECQHGDVLGWIMDTAEVPLVKIRFGAVCRMGELNENRCGYQPLPDGSEAIPRFVFEDLP